MAFAIDGTQRLRSMARSWQMAIIQVSIVAFALAVTIVLVFVRYLIRQKRFAP